MSEREWTETAYCEERPPGDGWERCGLVGGGAVWKRPASYAAEEYEDAATLGEEIRAGVRLREDARAIDTALRHVMDQLDTYGAPPGDTIEERLRAWEQRERALREVAYDITQMRTDVPGFVREFTYAVARAMKALT